MCGRIIAVLCATCLVVPGVARAQAPETGIVQSESNTTRSPAGADRTDVFQRLGWELAAGEQGVRIERIIKNSPVAEAHLEEHDLIQAIAGEQVRTPDRVRAVLDKLANRGEAKTEIVVLRDGEERSYLLSLEPLTAPGGTRTRTTVQVVQADLVRMIQELQAETEQQRLLLQMLLSEVQNLRTQLGLPPNARVNPVAPSGN